MKKSFFYIIMLAIALAAGAQERLSLERCRQQALEANKSLLVANEKKNQSEAMRQMAFDQFLPKVTANGAAIWSNRSVQLLSDDPQNNLNNLGTNLTSNIMDRLGNGVIANYIASTNIVNNISGDIDGLGQSLVNDLNVDTKSIYAGMVSVTQPIFMGGKIRALYKIAAANSEVKNLELMKKRKKIF